MKLEDLVCSLELAQQLKELGVEQDSIWYWQEFKNGYKLDFNIVDIPEGLEHPKNKSSAFTVAELCELLPPNIKYENSTVFLNIERMSNDIDKSWLISFINECGPELPELFNNTKLADALAEMLIYLLENKLM